MSWQELKQSFHKAQQTPAYRRSILVAKIVARVSDNYGRITSDPVTGSLWAFKDVAVTIWEIRQELEQTRLERTARRRGQARARAVPIEMTEFNQLGLIDGERDMREAGKSNDPRAFLLGYRLALEGSPHSFEDPSVVEGFACGRRRFLVGSRVGPGYVEGCLESAKAALGVQWAAAGTHPRTPDRVIRIQDSNSKPATRRNGGANLSEVRADIAALELAVGTLQQVRDAIDEQRQAAANAAAAVESAWTDSRGQEIAQDCYATAQAFTNIFESLQDNVGLLLRKIDELKTVLGA